jgi:hypothetical protein
MSSRPAPSVSVARSTPAEATGPGPKRERDPRRGRRSMARPTAGCRPSRPVGSARRVRRGTGPAGPGGNRRRSLFSPPRRTVATACLAPSVWPADSAAGPSGAGPGHRSHRDRNPSMTPPAQRRPGSRALRRRRPQARGRGPSPAVRGIAAGPTRPETGLARRGHRPRTPMAVFSLPKRLARNSEIFEKKFGGRPKNFQYS